MASETLFEQDLIGTRGEAYKVARGSGGKVRYTDHDGNIRVVKYHKPTSLGHALGDIGVMLSAPVKPGYWYDCIEGRPGIRVTDGETVENE